VEKSSPGQRMTRPSPVAPAGLCSLVIEQRGGAEGQLGDAVVVLVGDAGEAQLLVEGDDVLDTAVLMAEEGEQLHVVGPYRGRLAQR
jgi:hypothetical protein